MEETGSGESEARLLLSEMTRYLASMPDAGLTNDDPRQAWYIHSKPLRDRALGFLSGHAIGCIHGQSGYRPYVPTTSCRAGYLAGMTGGSNPPSLPLRGG